MSTVKTSNIQNAGSTTVNLALDTSGNATCGGVVSMASSFLRNRLINGNFAWWGRSTSSTGTGYTTADRWVNANTNSIALSTDTPSGAGFLYSVEFSSNTATFPYITQRIEAANCTDLAGKVVTLSFWAKNVSGASTLVAQTSYANTVDTFSSSTLIGSFVSTGASPSSAWTFYSGSVTLPASAANGIDIQIYRGNAAAATTRITGVQLEVGSIVTPFERRLVGLERLLCERYFTASLITGATTFSVNDGSSVGMCHPTANFRFGVQFRTPMRIAPAITTYDAAGNANKHSYYTSTWNNNGTFGVFAPNATYTGFYCGHNIASSVETQFIFRADAEL